MIDPTKEIYQELQGTYNFFNEELFAGELPKCLITIQRKRSTKGYFAPKWWKNTKGRYTDEIALNPDFIKEYNVKEALSTLVHEMCHLWQEHYGKPSDHGYHNKQWAQKMQLSGLTPSDTGQAGGEMLGYTMTHYITPNGIFL